MREFVGSPGAVGRMHRFAGSARPLAACLLIAVSQGDTRAATLTGVLTEAYEGRLRALADSFGRGVARSLPVVAASPGIHYEYDYESNTYVRHLSVAGELYVERADPIGRGRWDFSLAYQHVRFDRFGDQDLQNLSDPYPIIDPGSKTPLISIKHEDIDVEVHEAILNVIWGLSDSLDLSLLVPTVSSSLSVSEELLVFGSENGSREVFGKFGASGTGVGDIVLRCKLSLFRGDWIHASGGLALTLPSGSDDNFQGVGALEVAPGLFASSKRRDLGGAVALQGHANLSMVLNTENISQSEGRWGVAGDLAFGGRATIGLALLGRHAVSEIFPQGVIDFPRCLSACGKSNATVGPRPLFGLSGQRPNYLNLSFGGRVVLWRDSVIAFANVLVPLLDQGLTSEPVPLLGIEVSL